MLSHDNLHLSPKYRMQELSISQNKQFRLVSDK